MITCVMASDLGDSTEDEYMPNTESQYKNTNGARIHWGQLQFASAIQDKCHARCNRFNYEARIFSWS